MTTDNTNINEEPIYDDDKCIECIRQYVGAESPISKLDNDSLLYLIDLMYDFMESRGLLDEENVDEDIEIDLEEMYDYTVKNIKRDEMEIEISMEDFIQLHDAEQEYTETLV